MIWRTVARVSGSKARAHGDFAIDGRPRSEPWSRVSSSSSFSLELEILDVVEKLDDFLVRAVTERAQESRGEEFAAAFPAIEVDVKQIAGVELDFDPGTAIRDNPEAVEHLAVECMLDSNAMPGERCNWLTTTRSAPLMTKVPCGVMSGISPM